MEDPTAKMAMGFAGQGMAVGQQYMEQNVRMRIVIRMEKVHC